MKRVIQSRHRSTDLNIKTKLMCKTYSWFSTEKPQLRLTPLSLYDLPSGCDISIQSDWAGNPRVLEGCICPILSMSHPGWRGHNGKSSCFPIMFPHHKYLWAKAPRHAAPRRSPQQDDTRSVTTSAALPSPPSAPGDSWPQTTPNQPLTGDCTAPPFSTTAHKHHWTPPMFTG